MPVLGFLLIASPVACGRKGELVPASQGRPSPVHHIDVKVESDGIHLTWKTPLTNADGSSLIPISGYLVLRAAGTQGFTRVGVVRAPFSFWGVETMSFRDENVVAGTPYRYRVVAVNALRGESEPATSDRVVPGVETPPFSQSGEARTRSSEIAAFPVEDQGEGNRVNRAIRNLNYLRGPEGEMFLWWEHRETPPSSGFLYEVHRFDAEGAATLAGRVGVPFFTDFEPSETVMYRVQAKSRNDPNVVVGTVMIAVGDAGRGKPQKP